MTATESQTAEPRTGRPWGHVIRWAIQFALIWLVPFWPSLPPQSGLRLADKNLWALGLGWTAALLIQACRPARGSTSSATTPWYSDAIAGVLFLVIGTIWPRFPVVMPSYFRSVYLAAAGAFLVTAVWKFFRARQKFTLLTLMLFTFGVAIVCSVNHYVMLLPLLFFLAPPALEWTRFGPPTLSLDPAKRAEWRSKPPSGSADEGSEEDRMVRLHPSDADRQRVMEMVERATPRPPSPSRGEDAPKNSQFEI